MAKIIITETDEFIKYTSDNADYVVTNGLLTGREIVVPISLNIPRESFVLMSNEVVSGDENFTADVIALNNKYRQEIVDAREGEESLLDNLNKIKKNSGGGSSVLSDLRYYYGREDILPTPETYFQYQDNGDGTCAIIGISLDGLTAQPTEIVYPYEINGLKVIEIRNDALDSGDYNSEYTFNQATSVAIPLSVTKIGNSAFSGTKITDIYIPDSVTEIRGTPFCGCSLKTIRLSENLKVLSNALFYSAGMLDTLYIPDSVENIDESQPGVCIMYAAKYVSIPHHTLFSHSSPIDVSDAICEIRGGEVFKQNGAPCFGVATNVRIIFPRTCKTIDGLIALDASNCVFEIPSSVVGITYLASGRDNTIVCEQGSFADYWGQDTEFNIKYNIVRDVGGELPVASYDTLGGVKVGTNIGINSEDKIYVYDNSHNHVVENITGLDAKFENVQRKASIYNINASDYGNSYYIDLSNSYNSDSRVLGILDSLRILIPNEAYESDYILGLGFNSGETATSITYTSTGILNWVGTDCSVSEGYSIFQPSPNTHYDIVFYFNGEAFVGLVNGFKYAIGNVVSE